MITCSNIRAQGADYLTRHLSSNDYYSEGESIVGTWFGEGCERLGLVPGAPVAKEDFAALGNNRKLDGSKLTAMDAPDRKSWTDVQVSVPKDISILALVAGDERLLAAADRAADLGLGVMQHYAGTRERRGALHASEETRRTGNIVAARYAHDASRALDPQIHKHFVVLNATYDSESGRQMALQSKDMMLASKYAVRVALDYLAGECERLGYRVKNETHGNFQIEGITDELREKFSQREAQIDVEAKKFEVEHGRAPSAKERAVLTRESREDKLREITTAEVREYQRGRLTPTETQALADLVASAVAAPAAAPVDPLASPADLDARLDGALRHATERNSVVREWDALEAVYALKPTEMRLDAAAVAARLAARTTGPNADLHSGFGSRLTTAEAAREEADTVRLALAGRGACAPLASVERLDATQSAAEAVPGADRLMDDQLSAARMLAGCQDRVSCMIGDAGTGKTFMLQRLRDASDAPWIALGPTTRAKAELKANGFAESETVAAFLQSPKKQAAAAGSVLLVDEAGLLDMAQMRAIFRVAEDVGARVLLTGDPKQHHAVGRGDALRSVLNGARYADAAGTVEPYALDAKPADPNARLDPLTLNEAKEHVDHHETLEITPEDEQIEHRETVEPMPEDEKFDHRKTFEPMPDDEKASNQLEFTTLEDTAARRPGLCVARLQTVRRQTLAEHREVSDLLAKGMVVEALDKQVNELKTVQEVKNEKELFSSAAGYYMERREALAADRGGQPARSPDLLGLCRTWEDIGKLSGEIRDRMKTSGQIGEDRQMQIVQPSGWTNEENTVAAKYQPGKHVLTFQSKVESIGAKPGENWSVEAVDVDGLTVRKMSEDAPRQGQRRQASPQSCKISFDDLRGVEVGERREIPLAPGDQIQFRANCRDGKKQVANNGDVRQIKSIGKDGRLNLIGGGQVPASFKNFCHGYAVTSHKSQGASVKETVVVMGAAACGSADVRSNYVNMTRHKDASRIFVADLEGMKASLVRSAAARPGRELVAEMPVAPLAGAKSTSKAERRPSSAMPAAASVVPVRPLTPAAAAKVGEPAAPVARTVSPVVPPGEDNALRPMAAASVVKPVPARGSVEEAVASGLAHIEAARAARGPSVLPPAMASLLGKRRIPSARPEGDAGATKRIAGAQTVQAAKGTSVNPIPSPSPSFTPKANGLSLGPRRVPVSRPVKPATPPVVQPAPALPASEVKPAPTKPPLLLRLTRKLTRSKIIRKIVPGHTPVEVSRNPTAAAVAENILAVQPATAKPPRSRGRGMSR